MSRLPRYDVLFEPVRIGPKVMRNRFYQTPHDSALGNAPKAEAYFRGMKAEGGWGVVNTGQVAVSLDSDYAGFHIPAQLCDDIDARNWSLMADRVHDGGALAGIELGAIDSAVSAYHSRVPARAITGVADDHFWMGASYAMDTADIKRLQADYVAAAKRARSVGFDIVNVHGAEGWSICSRFLMRHYNQRRDEYGGSLENRARFWLETLELVREAVGDDCAIAARHCIETFSGEDGIRLEEEGIGFVELADHLVDFWDVQVGRDPRDISPSRFFKENANGDLISEVRRHTRKPLVSVGRFTSPDTMVTVITNGQQDIIGAARASISDPFLPTKIAEGRIDEIRECIGCNICESRVEMPGRIICTQNPTTGEEYRRGWHPEQFVRAQSTELSVLIVGGGPAGLECATVLARQGIEAIHLVETSRHVGGHLRWVARLSGLAEWIRVIDYRKAIAEKLQNLAVVTNKRLSLEEILDYGADRVILATGSHWAKDGLNGISRGPIPGLEGFAGNVYTPERIMVNEHPLEGDRITVYDCDGYFMGVSLAERAAIAGKAVTYVTPLPSVAPYLDWTLENTMMIPRLHELGVKMITNHVVETVDDAGVSVHLRSYPEHRDQWETDSIILVTQRVPEDVLYRELQADHARLREAGIQAVYRIGDCLAPRPQVADAIFDGHRLAREIDTADPMSPLPFIRERRVVGIDDAELESAVSAEPHSHGVA